MTEFDHALDTASQEFEERLDLDIAQLVSNPIRRVAVAESITAGLLCERLTRVPGSSRYFVGGIVCYTDMIKLQYCGVQAAVLSQYGPVSAPVAAQMAQGIQKNFKADIGISVTGYAGPDRHNPEKTGGVFIGIQNGTKQRVFSFKFEGTRNEIKAQTVQAALVQLKQWVGTMNRPTYNSVS
jgi:PncC family amidohydrolase